MGRIFKEYTVAYTDESGNQETPNATGEYTARIELADTTNYRIAQGEIQIFIRAATQDQLVLVGLPGTIQYKDSFTLEAIGGVEGDGTYEWTSNNSNVTFGTGEATASVEVNIGEAVGQKVEITVKKSIANYEDVTTKVILMPQAKNVTFELSGLEQTYGSVKAVTVSASDPAATYKVTYGGAEALPEDAGTYTVKVTATDNYTGTADAYLTVEKADESGSISTGQTDYAYGDTPTASASDLLDGTEAKITYAGNGIYTPQEEAPTAAGNYTEIATIEGENYKTLTLTKNFTIEKKELKVRGEDASRAYGKENPLFMLQYDGFV